MSPLGILTLIFGVLAAILFTVAGWSKLSGQKAMRESAKHLGIPWPRYRAIGALEILIVAGIVAGFWFGEVGIAAGAVAVVLMIGALGYHARAHDSRNAMGPAISGFVLSVGYLVVQIFSL